MRNKVIAAGICLLLPAMPSLLPIAASARGEDLLELTRAGNKSAIQSIRTFSCRATISRTPAGSIPPPGVEYWRSADAVRVKTTQFGSHTDSVLRDSRLTTLTRTPAAKGQSGVVAIRHAGGVSFGERDVWRAALLSLPVPTREGPGTFEDLLNTPHKLLRVERETVEGRELILVSLGCEQPNLLTTVDLWFDPRVNFLVRKYVATSRPRGGKGKIVRDESEVVRFKEAMPGIYFPEKVHFRLQPEGGKAATKDTTFSAIQVNQPLPPDTFRLRFPRGVLVLDTIQGKKYKADEDGNPMGPSSALPQVGPEDPGRTRQTETTEEEKPLTRWILPVSLAILGLGTFLWVARKWRGRKDASTPFPSA